MKRIKTCTSLKLDTCFYSFQDIEFDPRLWKWNEQEEMSRYNAKYSWKMFKLKIKKNLVTNLFLVILQLQHRELVPYFKCLNFLRNPCCHLLPNINHGPKIICIAKNQNQIHCEIGKNRHPFPIAYFLRKVHMVFCLNHWDVFNHHILNALLLLL